MTPPRKSTRPIIYLGVFYIAALIILASVVEGRWDYIIVFSPIVLLFVYFGVLILAANLSLFVASMFKKEYRAATASLLIVVVGTLPWWQNFIFTSQKQTNDAITALTIQHAAIEKEIKARFVQKK